MKSIKTYWKENQLRLILTIALFVAFAMGAIDPALAAMGGFVICDTAPSDLKELHRAMQEAFGAMKEAVKKSQDTADKALEEVRKEGTVYAKTADELKKFGESATLLTNKLGELESKSGKMLDDYGELKDRTLSLEQKAAHRPGNDQPEMKTAGEIAAASEEFKVCAANPRLSKMSPTLIGSFHKARLLNAPGQNQPLVPSVRVPGIITPGLREFTVRDLMPQQRTTGNLIEFASELVFTNNAAPQGGSTGSPDITGEGELKAESGITFQLSSEAVTTIAHGMPVSKQILADAPMLQSYVDGRLTYGLKLEEESEMMNGTGSHGQLHGLVTQATQFTGGATNQTVLDTLLKAFLQISLSYFEATGVVLHPTDWTALLLLKDSQNRYLFGDPHNMTTPRVWGKPVVATQAQTLGQFLAGAFALAAEVWDREDATVAVYEQHSDFAQRNLVWLQAEERAALAVYRTAALVKGNTSYAG